MGDNDGFFTVTNKKRKRTKDADMESDTKRPCIKPLSEVMIQATGSAEQRVIRVPPNRYTALKNNWIKLTAPIKDILRLDIKFNTASRQVEIRNSRLTENPTYLQKAADFVQAFIYGFEVEDALALVRLDDLFLDSFEIKDVKMLTGDHVNRAIGRMAGKGGRTRYTIENATKTRIIIDNKRIHILGSYDNVRAAKTTLSTLVLGNTESKVFGKMQRLSKLLGSNM
ncbi:PNO1 [Cordylochernes scorpioides]|uniref:PNO1 n=1 Tax=Cordylochernes scorpioides TaxID=51811 RepID=A0ABY6LC56_9ARAC|nr:PNO1 [Cordylochernes scorpioides]